MKIIITLIATILLTSCSGNNMKPIDFKDQKPRLIIEEYLSGNVKAWGILLVLVSLSILKFIMSLLLLFILQ